jgi:hypothetical protein
MRIHAWFDGLNIDKSTAFLTPPQIVNLQTFKPSNLHMRNMHHISAIRFVPNQYAPYKGLDDMGDITNRRFDMNGLIFPRKNGQVFLCGKRRTLKTFLKPQEHINSKRR